MNMELRAAREQSRMTQAQAAEMAGITERSYQRIESGKATTVSTALLIAESFGITEFNEFKKLFGAATPEETEKEPDGNPT